MKDEKKEKKKTTIVFGKEYQIDENGVLISQYGKVDRGKPRVKKGKVFNSEKPHIWNKKVEGE